MATTPDPSRRSSFFVRRRFTMLAVVVTLIAASVWSGWSRWRDRSDVIELDDPRLTFDTPYRNVRPDVKYVGDEACARCHPDQAATYRKHPMGRSLGHAAQVIPLEKYDANSRNPFEAFGFRYRIVRQNADIRHEEASLGAQGVAEMKAGVEFALGSGTRGRSYLINRDGFLFQSPISWYSHEQRWDLAPGYKEQHPHFERPITAPCLFCHANRVEPVENILNRFHAPIFQGESIGCERCHGPGELHVARREGPEEIAGLDDTIVNPRRLEPVLREAVCQQCHLQGEKRIVRRGREIFDFRPGLPMHLFWSVFVRPEDFAETHRSVNHIQQMQSSRCYRESVGKMGCISCHDPHYQPEPAERADYFRKRCISCHQQNTCSVPIAARVERNKDSCYSCHMLQAGSANIAHTAVTDHRILKNPGDEVKPTAARKLRIGEIPLVHYHRELVSADDEAAQRDLGIALSEMTGPAVAAPLARMALPLLDRAVQAHPDDVPALEARGNVLFILQRDREALEAFERILALASDREASLIGAAAAAGMLGKREAAINYQRRLVEVNPWRSEYHVRLAKWLLEDKKVPDALAASRKALQLNPADAEARKLLVECYVRQGATDAARKEFQILLELDATKQNELKEWFDGLRRADE